MALTVTVEAEFSAGVWTAITDDVLVSALRLEIGMVGQGPNDRCASTGTLRGELVSSPAGTYLPGHAACVSGWDLGTQVRLKLTDGVTTTTRFVGRIRALTPGTGPHRAGRRVQFEAQDWMGQAADTTVADLSAQIDQRADQLVTTIISSMTRQPAVSSLSTGDAVFPFALDDVRDEQTRVLQALAGVVHSEQGYLYQRGDGTLRLENRSFRSTDVSAPAATLSGTMHGLRVDMATDQQPNWVQVTVRPRVVDAAATTVLFKRYDISAGQTALTMAAGQTFSIFGPYGDPANNNERCGGTSMVTPVATTDYTANAQADGGGADRTSDLSVTASFTANGVYLTLTNTSATTFYVTKLQTRGKGIYNRAPVVLEATRADATQRVAVGMPYEASLVTGQAVADRTLRLWGSSYPVRVRFRSLGAARQTAAASVDLGARVAITEATADIDGEYFVSRIEQAFVSASHVDTWWALVPVDTDYWLLGVTGFSELDETTRLGYL